MSTVQDIVTSLVINSATSVGFICAYAFLKNQPVNARVYFSKWLKMDAAAGPQDANPRGRRIGRYINLNLRSYVHIMDWIKTSLRMKEAELIEHAGLDSAIYLRILLLGMQIFAPMMAYSFVVLVPIDVTDHKLALDLRKNSADTYSALDTISISNVEVKSSRLWAHIIAAYLYTVWTCWLLYRLYESLVTLRFAFLASRKRTPDQFTILCRCIPGHPVKEQVDRFFQMNHPDYFLLNSVVYNANALSKLVEKKENYKNKVTYYEGIIDKVISRPMKKLGFLGLWGERVDKLDYYTQQVKELTVKIRDERIRILSDDKSVMPAAFVSFENTWAAAVCSQTKQSKDLSKWLTEWAPEPRDVFWGNLPIPYLQLNSRKLISLALLVVMILFYLIPVTFVQSLANLDKLEKELPFLKPLIDFGLIKSILTGYLPGLALTIFLAILPTIVWYLAMFEGHVSYSKIEKHACINYLAFMLVNVFLGNLLTGTAFDQLKLFIETPTQIPNVIGTAITQKSIFFITYILADGWTGTASELLRLLPLILYHFKNATILRTDRDRKLATPVDCIQYTVQLPRLGLYFLLGFVYSTVSPMILPFILIYLGATYVVYRNQMINVYDQKYESSGAYWPVMFAYAIIGLLVMDATLIGLMALKRATLSTPFLIPLPVFTILFWYYCKMRFEEAFDCYPLEEAKAKDAIYNEHAPSVDRKEFLETAYMHPTLRATLMGDGNADESDSDAAVGELLHRIPVRPSRRNNDESSGGRGSSTEKRRLHSVSSTPTLPIPSESWIPNRPMPSGSLPPNWSIPSESWTPNGPMSSGGSSPKRQGSDINMQGNIPGGKESSIV